ncbi:uncharacterized protein LOC135346024 isoform X2 [Halichondria panicea]|uniref:uncharacterized protein LOC135346024 isoform X2 n=1 Tax=Halichondria panicea TaxID=6063 RepID=UPI00312B8868
MSQVTTDPSHGSVDAMFRGPPTKQARYSSLMETDFSAEASNQITRASSGIMPHRRHMPLASYRPSSLPPFVRRSARLAEQNRSSADTIHLSPTATSPAVSIHPDEVIDLITPPPTHPSSSGSPSFTRPPTARAGPTHLLFGDESRHDMFSAVPTMPTRDSGGPSSSQGGFSPFMYPTLLQDARTMPQRSSLLSSPTHPHLIPTESLRSREQQRESVIRNNYRTSSRYRDPVVLGNYPNEMSAQIGHNYQAYPSIPNSLNPVQRVPIASSLPQWSVSNFDSYTVPSGGDTSGFYRVAPTGLPRSFALPQSRISTAQSISTVLHPPFMHHGSEAPHTLNTYHDEEDELIPLSQHIHPLRQTSARTNHAYPGPSTDSSQIHPVPPPSSAANSRPVSQQARQMSRYPNSAHPGPSTDTSQAQPSTGNRRAGNRTCRMSCRRRPPVPPTNESGSSGSSSGTGSSNGRASHSGSADVLIVVDDSDSDDDVIIESWVPGNSRIPLHVGSVFGQPAHTQVNIDEVYARQLQAQYDQESTTAQQHLPHMGRFRDVPVVPAGPSVPSSGGNQESDGSGVIWDNFDALASRVHSWTRQDATRFLHASYMARPGPRNHRQIMENARRMPANILVRAIIGDNPAMRLTYEDLLELAENIGPARPQGLTKATLDRLPVHMWERSNEEQKCVVCMCSYEAKERVRFLPCTHNYHQDCIDQWFKDHSTCPICRVEVKSE